MAGIHKLPTLERPAPELSTPDDLSLYLHWPFCVSKCPYCDFNSHVREKIDALQWQAAYFRALDLTARQTGKRRIRSIFFGGGTPSLMPPALTAALLDKIASSWTIARDCEITLEANPGTIDSSRFQGFKTAGINRLSLGVQSFDDEALRFLGRAHDSTTARKAIALAQSLFPRVSFDLIYALPSQTPTAWEAQLREALAFGTEHLSVYQLTIEEGTRFATLYDRGDIALPDEDRAATLFTLTQSILAEAGLPAYEISNHARPGAESRHNLTYWLYGDYAGIGPGAHGRLTLASGQRIATRAHRAPEAWLDYVMMGSDQAQPSEEIDRQAALTELTLMGLRLNDGIPRMRYRDLFGEEPEALYDAAKLRRLTAGGFLVLDAAGLRASDQGRLKLNAVIAALV